MKRAGKSYFSASSSVLEDIGTNEIRKKRKKSIASERKSGLLPINYNFPPRYQHATGLIQRSNRRESSTWNSLFLSLSVSNLIQFHELRRISHYTYAQVRRYSFTRLGRLLDDSRSAGDQLRQRREEATGGASERGVVRPRSKGTRSPLLFYSRLSAAAKRGSAERGRERAARTCSAGKATLFSFLSRKSIVKTRCIGWQTPDNTRASSDR